MNGGGDRLFHEAATSVEDMESVAVKVVFPHNDGSKPDSHFFAESEGGIVIWEYIKSHGWDLLEDDDVVLCCLLFEFADDVSEFAVCCVCVFVVFCFISEDVENDD